MFSPLCDTLHSAENLISPARPLSGTTLQEVQHAGLSPRPKSLVQTEGPVASSSCNLAEGAPIDLQHAEDSTFRNVSRLTLSSGPSRPGVQRLNILRESKGLLRDTVRDAAWMVRQK